LLEPAERLLMRRLAVFAGGNVFGSAWAEGRALSLDAAVALEQTPSIGA
jgi:hypothetical protein